MNKVHRVNFRDIENNFEDAGGHIVSYQFGPTDAESHISIDFYPNCLHPGLEDLRAIGKRGHVNDSGLGCRVMTIYPKGTLFVHFSPMFIYPEGFWFTQDDHRLLQYEDFAGITSNSPITPDQWTSIVQQACSKLSLPHLQGAQTYLGRRSIERWGTQPSFSLGPLPRTIFFALRDALDAHDVPYFAPREPEAKPVPALLDIDGYYIVAEDFDVDWPEWEHRPEWIVPYE